MFTKIEDGNVLDGVLTQIIGQVKKGKLKPGGPLPSVGSMAEELGVSKETVQDCLRTLVMLGISKPAPNNVYYIAENPGAWMTGPLSVLFKVNEGYMRQSQQLRAGLQIEAAILAARKCTPLDAAQLLHIIDAMDEAEDETDRKKIDYELHQKIAEIADNPLIYNIILAADDINDNIIAGTREYIYSTEKSLAEADGQHRRLVEAILSNDEKKAGEVMYEHMRMTEKYIDEYLSKK